MHIKITDFGTAKLLSGTDVNQKGKYTSTLLCTSINIHEAEENNYL